MKALLCHTFLCFLPTPKLSQLKRLSFTDLEVTQVVPNEENNNFHNKENNFLLTLCNLYMTSTLNLVSVLVACLVVLFMYTICTLLHSFLVLFEIIISKIVFLHYLIIIIYLIYSICITYFTFHNYSLTYAVY